MQNKYNAKIAQQHIKMKHSMHSVFGKCVFCSAQCCNTSRHWMDRFITIQAPHTWSSCTNTKI